MMFKKKKDAAVSNLKIDIEKFGDDIEKLYQRSRQSYNLFRLLSSSSRDAVIVSEKKDGQYIIQSVNRTACDLFCSPCEQPCQYDINETNSPLIGMPISKLFESGQCPIPEVEKRQGMRRIVVTPCVALSGRVFNAEVSSNVSKLDDHNVRICVFRDITFWEGKQEELTSSNNMLKAILENSPNYLVVVLLDLTIEYVNPLFCEASGYRLEDVKGRKVIEFIPQEHIEHIMRTNRKRHEGDISVLTYVTKIICKSGRAIDVEIKSAPVELDDSGKLKKTVAIIRELSDAEIMDRNLRTIKKLGEILLEYGFITEYQLDQALELQKQIREK